MSGFFPQLGFPRQTLFPCGSLVGLGLDPVLMLWSTCMQFTICDFLYLYHGIYVYLEDHFRVSFTTAMCLDFIFAYAVSYNIFLYILLNRLFFISLGISYLGLNYYVFSASVLEIQKFYYNYVLWVSQHLKWPATPLLVQQFVFANIKGNIKALSYWPFVIMF